MGKNKSKAVPTLCDGIQFKSRLEAYCYQKLKENNIKAPYEKRTFTIMKAFKYKGKKIQKMTYTPDFVGENFVIECKGQMNDSFPLRWKIFKYYLFTKKLDYDLYLPRNNKQVDIVISKIKEKLQNKPKNKLRKIKDYLSCLYI